jgi:ribosomal protein L11 methyltransferase
MDSVIALVITFEPSSKELVISQLLELGVCSFQEGGFGFREQTSGLSVPNEEDTITCYFDNEREAKLLCLNLRDALPQVKLESETRSIANEEWKESWKKYSQSVRISDQLLICPTWDTDELEQVAKNEIRLILDPGMAFGSGAHETTKMCLSILEECCADAIPQSFLDIGSGSGILSLYAAKRGVATVQGIDICEDAIRVADENAIRNEVPQCSFSCQSLNSLGRTYDLVCANILSSTINMLWQDILDCTKNGAPLILSGILSQEVDEFIAKHELKPIEIRHQGEWAAILLQKS